MSQSKVSVNTLKKTLSSGMSLITNLFNFFGWEVKGGGVGVGAYSRLGAYSNKYGISFPKVRAAENQTAVNKHKPHCSRENWDVFIDKYRPVTASV